MFGCELNDSNDLTYQTIWYDKPAEKWDEALPLGNGRLGVMVFGNPNNERIQLNDDSLWPYHDNWNEPEGTEKDLLDIRKHLLNENPKSADSLIVEKFSNKSITLSHQTLGDLFLNWNHQKISDYKRSLDLNTAISTTKYKTDGYLVKQKVFVSHPNQIIVIEIESEHPEGLNGEIQLNRPKDEGVETVSLKYEDDKIIMSGEVTQRGGKFRELPVVIESGVKFETLLTYKNEFGSIFKNGQKYYKETKR